MQIHKENENIVTPDGIGNVFMVVYKFADELITINDWAYQNGLSKSEGWYYMVHFNLPYPRNVPKGFYWYHQKDVKKINQL